jgi:putative transposase
MSIGGYKIRNKKEIHFITFAVVEWLDVFTRQLYRDILLDSLRFCQKEKGLILNCWCVMSNHVHLIAGAENFDLSNILRDFKKFTSKQIISAIQNHPGESRKDWMMRVFREQGSNNSRNKEFQFWRQENHPVELFSPKVTVQKMQYVHDNPVRAGIVDKPEDYLYSSARAYKFKGQPCLLDVVFL